MRLADDSLHYGAVTKLLHWLTALLIIALIALGWYMVELTYFDRWYNESLLTHKALGMIVFAAGVVTLIWRAVSASPAPLPEHKAWERVAARSMHRVLMLMVLMLPVSGYLISTSAGKAIDFFGWFEIPALLSVTSGLRDGAITVHYYFAYATALLVALHAAAALKHQFFDGDGTLARMIWR